MKPKQKIVFSFDERSYESLDKMIEQGRHPSGSSTCPSDYKEIPVTNSETGETRIIVIPKSDEDYL